MTVRVLFFGATADLVGQRAIEFPISGQGLVSDVLEQLTAEHPGLQGRQLLFAINERYVVEQTSLNDGDELAIFAPVSGG